MHQFQPVCNRLLNLFLRVAPVYIPVPWRIDVTAFKTVAERIIAAGAECRDRNGQCPGQLAGAVENPGDVRSAVEIVKDKGICSANPLQHATLLPIPGVCLRDWVEVPKVLTAEIAHGHMVVG